MTENVVHDVTPASPTAVDRIQHYAFKTTKIALIGLAVIGSVVVVQRLRENASEDGELTTLQD